MLLVPKQGSPSYRAAIDISPVSTMPVSFSAEHSGPLRMAHLRRYWRKMCGRMVFVEHRTLVLLPHSDSGLKRILIQHGNFRIMDCKDYVHCFFSSLTLFIKLSIYQCNESSHW